MAAPQASSRLEMLQARFQQKQLQEKEQKLLQLYDQQQQRAYQVVQRGSAGSNGSNHGSSSSHHTVTRTSSTTHTTSTSQGGKVRQMFDERRQTTVKGIDRSYPLEPLENKTRKQGAANGGHKNGNVTVNRQSVTVKRVARADVNSNVNGGKPVISYHEEITRQSYDPSLRHHGDEDEFGNENHVLRYANGNYPEDSRSEVQIEEILDEDTIDRGREMGKINLLEFEENLKQRVRNDLESEEFPEHLIVDAPDRLPKRNVTKKLSQAEARLERFKNANLKRSTVSKTTTSTPSITKKRSEPIFPAKSSLRNTKSPSPDPVARKSLENNIRPTARRSVPSSPCKSPDTLARRPSTDLKCQEAKSSKRLPAVRQTESINSRKATVTKSMDVVDGVVLENGLHSRDRTVETKSENDPPPARKGDAFIVDFEDRTSKEDDAPIPRKSTPRKHPVEKQTSSTPGGRPVSSISSASSGSSTHGQVSGSRGKMTTRAKTPISGASPSKGLSATKSGGSTDNLVGCKICGRRFAHDRVSLHEQICAKTVQKKRKQFDAMMFRVKGTELEPFVKKGLTKKQSESKSKKPEVKSNWRRKHEDFINAIRSAKQVQAHLAAGGKLSDLPPPPASDTSDYIQCPHCGRKFNQAAAERHIPKCEHMLHNKPTHARVQKPRR